MKNFYQEIDKTETSKYAVISKDQFGFRAEYFETFLPAAMAISWLKEHNRTYKFVRIPGGEIISQS